jgi:hypothetical protein
VVSTINFTVVILPILDTYTNDIRLSRTMK